MCEISLQDTEELSDQQGDGVKIQYSRGTEGPEILGSAITTLPKKDGAQTDETSSHRHGQRIIVGHAHR